MLTAYIRVFGAACGSTQDFSGPMAKQHRMFVIIIGALAAAFELVLFGTLRSLVIALSVILIGGIVTCINRTKNLFIYIKNST